jgi:hypothetical protein
MPPPDVRAHVAALVGTTIPTVTGHDNEVLRVEGDRVFVRTGHTRPSRGEPVDIGVLEEAAQRLWRDGELPINTDSVGYRSAFVGAALGSVPGVAMARRPARLLLADTSRGKRRGPATEARWWAALPQERFWLEVSDREAFGHDLRAPDDQRTSHALVNEVRAGDVVFHYDKARRSIIGWSEVSRPARRVAGEYRARLGGLLGLTQVSLARLREFDAAIREIAVAMEDLGYDMRGFPFERSGSRPIRPLPAYLAKLPLSIVELLPELAEAAALISRRPRAARRPKPRHAVGGDYRSANEGVTIPVIWSAETSAWRAERAAQRAERSTRAHNRLQNELERFLRDHGIPTLSPERNDVPFDLAWRTDDGLAFAEVKSVSAGNESQRLRLGLGQCLFYRHALEAALDQRVATFLAIPNKPDDPAWPDACAATGVRLIWPSTFADAFSLRRSTSRRRMPKSRAR